MTFRILELFGRILSIFRKRKLDDDFNEELASHIEMAIEENIRAGMSPREARRQALIRFGGVEAARELHRDVRGLPLIEKIVLDARYAFRMFRKNPGFTLAVIITLALCIGPNTAIFSMLDALVIKPLPFHESDRIVSIYTKIDGWGSMIVGSNVLQYRDFKENADAFTHLALWEDEESNLGIGDEAIHATGLTASAELLELLGLNPLLGRFFRVENEGVTDNKEVVLAQSFWESHFHEDPGAIGRTIQIDGEAYEIIGITPRAFKHFNAQTQFIIPLKRYLWQTTARQGYSPFLLGRLKPDITIDAASARMTALEKRAFKKEFPSSDRNGPSIGIKTLQASRIDSDLKMKLYFLQGAVLFVLLIGCVNVINLFLSRSNARQGELVVRIALGSGKRAISRQLFVESFLLTWIGTVLGIILALGVIKIINGFTAQLLPKSLPFAVDGRMLAFTIIVATLTSLVIGLFQNFHVFGNNLLTLTQNQSQRVSSSRSLRSMSGALITAQMAITLVLLIGGGLLIHSFANLLRVDYGFNPKQLITARISLPAVYIRDNRAGKFQQRLKENLNGIPGFTSISIPGGTPYNGSYLNIMNFKLQGYEQTPGETLANLARNDDVDPSYLETMQIPLIEGRWFNSGDCSKSRAVCVVDQNFARQYFPGRSAVGKQVTSNIYEPEEKWPEIIGVVGSVRDLNVEKSLGSDARSLPTIHYPVQIEPKPDPTWNVSVGIAVLIRSPRPVHEVITLLRETVKGIDPSLPLYQTGSMEDIISTSFRERRAIMLLLCSFAGIALILSAVGIYGVLAYDVSKRTHEIGIRGAIGATNKQIITMVLRQGLWKAGIGLLIGIVGALYLSKFMTSLLFEVKPIDPLTFVLVPALLLVVAVLASYIPARQASRVEPALALRTE